MFFYSELTFTATDREAVIARLTLVTLLTLDPRFTCTLASPLVTLGID